MTYLSASALVLYKLLHQLILYPYVFSPLRKLPGPRGSLLSAKYLLFGEFPAIMAAEAGILQREWAKVYGTAMRAVGPFGMERVMFLSPPAMQKVLVDDWVEYPRVRSRRLAQRSIVLTVFIQPSFMRNILGIVAGYGLLTVTGDEHRMMRRTMNPAFSIPSLTARASMCYE